MRGRKGERGGVGEVTLFNSPLLSFPFPLSSFHSPSRLVLLLSSLIFSPLEGAGAPSVRRQANFRDLNWCGDIVVVSKPGRYFASLTSKGYNMPLAALLGVGGGPTSGVA